MPGIEKSLDIFDKFISIAKEIAKLPALVLPQYQSAAQDMYRICQKLLTANENLSRWLHKFIYFNFRQQTARTEFLNALQEYKTMKNGPEYQQLKFKVDSKDITQAIEISVLSYPISLLALSILQRFPLCLDLLNKSEKTIILSIKDRIPYGCEMEYT